MDCSHDIIGVESNKGWYECKVCGSKFRGAEAKALLGDYSDLPMGVTQIGNLRINKNEGGTTTMHLSNDEGPELVKPEHVEPVKSIISSGVEVSGKVATIICEDCGTERVIKIQDQFQVKRCVACQKKHRNHQRYLNRKARDAAGVTDTGSAE